MVAFCLPRYDFLSIALRNLARLRLGKPCHSHQTLAASQGACTSAVMVLSLAVSWPPGRDMTLAVAVHNLACALAISCVRRLKMSSEIPDRRH